jgi:hypothetical protein
MLQSLLENYACYFTSEAFNVHTLSLSVGGHCLSTLTRNMRTRIPGEGKFAAWLLQLSNGELNDTLVQHETIVILQKC